MDRRSAKNLAKKSTVGGPGGRSRRRLLNSKMTEAMLRESVLNKMRDRHGQLVRSIVESVDRTLSSVNKIPS
jgi:hypothetical protein